ncbi:MAG: hypothetical protein QM610_06160 [Chitinophagaceae bacterium]
MKYVCFFQLFILFTNCRRISTDKEQWGFVKIDSNLVKDREYKDLDKEEEIYSLYETEIPNAKRSSGVFYTTDDRDSLDTFARYFNCRAYLDSNNQLLIKVGIGGGGGARGFTITYRNKRFYTKPFYFTDVVYDNEVKPTYSISHQYLSLNKSIYRVGDSLYGKIDFKIFEMSGENINRVHLALGYFRSKVSIEKEYPSRK